MDINREQGTGGRSDGRQNGVAFYLDSADAARKSGNARLAIHLYCAAFEANSNQGTPPSAQVIEGLRKAWNLAIEKGDRSTAEAILDSLIPYNSEKQNEESLSRLQGLAVQQLEDAGLGEDTLADMVSVFRDNFEDIAGLLDGTDYYDADADDDDDEEADNDASGVNLPELVLPMLGLQPSNTAPSKQAAPVKKEKNQQQQQNNTLTYRNLIGYDSALKAMRKFGFMDAGDNEYKDFVQQAEKFQGVSGPVLSNAFLFRGPSREDTALFATATAGEINPSSIQVSIESDDNSNGVIKVMGPMRRNVWGAPRPADLPDPCVLLVKNIDTLNSFLNGHESNMKGGQRFMGPGGAYEGYSRGSLKSDILMQYNMLRSYHHIVLMATVKDDGEIDPELARIIGPMDVIDVPLPNVDERRDVLIQFAEEHPSFRNLNYRKLAYLSDGMSRHDLVKASQKAVDAAYRESLSTRFHHPVTVNDVLTQFVPYVDHKSATYKKIEDSLIAEFDQEIKILDT